MEMDTLWEESLGHRLKVERNLNFSTISNEDDEFGFSRKKTARDPMSHRIIEKRRRDRMNNCLADLSRLVPTNYLKKGRGRIEKTEIIEMAIKHLKHLQAHPCKDPATCEVAKTTEQDHKRQYRLGFQECMSETIRFLVEIEGLYAGDGLCLRLVNHLQKHYDKVTGGNCYTQALGMMSSEDSKMIPMDMEHTPSCFPIDSYPETPTPAEAAQVHHPLDSRPTEGIPPPDLPKQEGEGAVHSVNSSLPESSEFASGNGGTQVKVTSQLREMLQNPGLPKEHVRNNVGVMPSPKQLVPSTVNGNGSLMIDPHISINVPKCEEVYKFKNNIKHRFNADLRHLTASPTDSHSDQISLPDEEKTHLEQRSGQQFNCSTGQLPSSLLCPEGQSNNHGHQPPFSPFPSASLSASELCIKIPERTVAESGAASTGNWDCHGESGSSCGSNPSPPPVGRSNGSSSGYSTNGEMPPGSKLKTQHNERHSPALSPYSRTPDRLSNCSPSPQPVQQTTSGVPIFALHPKGTFYIPLTIDSSFVAPYLAGLDEVTPVLHPVSICVNFSLCHPMKMEKLNGTALQFRSHSFFIDRYNDRYMYGDRHHFYPCSPVHNTSN